MVKLMLCPRCWGAKTDPISNNDCTHCNSCATCKGSGSVYDMQLSEHFLLSEMIASQTAIRLRIPNEPDDSIIASLKLVCSNLLEPIRERFGQIHIDSGFRSLDLNRAVNSFPSSAHRIGYAADINVINKEVTRKQVVEWIISNIKQFDQVIFEGTWVHIAQSHIKADRNQALMMFGGKYYPYNSNDSRVNT